MPREVLTTVVPGMWEDGSIQVEVTLPVSQRHREPRGQPGPALHPGSRPRIPRITRLMALAIKFQHMVDCGEVRDYADLARLGYVTRARITQIMNMLNLAPDIQEEILGMPEGSTRETAIAERQIRSVARIVDWSDQQRAFMELKKLECTQG